MKIVIIFPKEFFSSEQIEKLSKYDLEFLEGNGIDLDQVQELYAADQLIICPDPTFLKDNWEAFPIERIKKMKGLKALCLTTTSYEWVDGKALANLGVIVTNCPGKSTNAVAEFNIFMMFSLFRHIPQIVKNEWKMDYKNFLNGEVKGKVAGIIGLGQIGTRTAELCKGLGMQVIYWNRTKKENEFEACELEELLKRSDVVFNTIKISSELKGFIDKSHIQKMKKGVFVVNSSGLRLFDEEYMFEAAKAGNIGGVAYESVEKRISDYEGNVMVFPEQAYYTRETLENTARILTDTVLSVIDGKAINKVN